MKNFICLLLTFIILVSSAAFVSASDIVNLDDISEKYVYRNDTYDFELMSDPMDVTDEEFFGLWDSSSENWIVESYFKYDEFPEMSNVEVAVKNGDYDKAKVELLNYYISKNDDLYHGSTTVTDSDRLQAKLQARNVYATNVTGNPIGIVEGLNKEWQLMSSTDVLTHVQNAASSGNDYVTFVIASIDKSNTPAEIKGKGSDTPPTLTLEVNKVAQTFNVYEDTYISPTTNSRTNYGDEKILLAQEHGYVGHWTDITAPWGHEASATKRTYIKFDISSLSSTDTISSAEFNFTARVADGGDLTEKELFIYGWEDSSWGEGSLVWDTYSDWLFFSCNDQEAWSFITSPKSTEKGKIVYFHRPTLLRGVANMYAQSGDEQYAYTFIRQLMSMIYHVGVNRNETSHVHINDDKNPDPYRVINHLDIGGYITELRHPLLEILDCQTFKDNPSLFTAILKNFEQMTNYMCEYIMEPEVISDNIASAHVRSAYLMCLTFPEFKMSDYWYEIAVKHNKRLLNIIVRPDGSIDEEGFGYTWTGLGPYSQTYNFYLATKNPKFGLLSDSETAKTLHGVVKYALYSTSPGWSGFNYADSIDHGVSYASNFRGWYKNLLKMGIDDPELEYVATAGKQGHVPEVTSISFPNALKTYMRSDWTENAIALGINAKGDYANHRHQDALNVFLCAYGKHLLIDPSYGSVLTGDIRTEMVHAKQHNTLTVNGGTIDGKVGQDGVEKEMELNDLFDFVTYSYGYVQNAANTERSILFLRNQKFFIVSDYVVPADTSKENVYTQFWHMLPEANIYISENNDFKSDFNTGANVIVSPVDAESMSNIFLDDAIYSPRIGSFVDNKKGVYERKSNDSVKYGTVIYPLEGGQDRQVETVTFDTPISDNEASAFRIRVTNTDNGNIDTYYYYHLSDLKQKQEVTLGKYKTDATTLLVHENMSAKVVDFFIYDGTYIERSDIKDKYLFKSSDGEKTVGVNFDAGNFTEIATASMEHEDLKNITVYAGFDTSASTFNGERIIDTKKDGAYIYYGDTPIVECTETAPDGTDDDINFGDFTGGSGGSSSGGSFGGGGLSGGGYIPPATDDKDDDSVKDDESIEPKPVTPTYGDVKESDWYFEYVEKLTEKGIVSGDGTGNFAPNSSVTREQFLKMLLISAGAETEEAENTFADVSDDAWYKEYVLKAKKLGVVNGVSDTEFGIGTNITRQDMAVMISRIIDILDIDVAISETTAFADESEVSDYAKESVILMKSIGLIEGYDNEFRPKDNLTRAEAAKIISCLLELL